ncbi:hypothetical protein RQP53_08680 [Paucibacter sp. APW11]|uniref:Tetratrico peptide repeat group 5 domain-containing protein n=1 Tax=Roseateles aquae TaxID=3077235 RepID=A0ABU3PB56_9BURK|nr:tetratricopeptide repeat protein [Paucibacter sp. APW11]MDT8999338.1 hypothetical protein [Paucibacter sp. APW11]
MPTASTRYPIRSRKQAPSAAAATAQSISDDALLLLAQARNAAFAEAADGRLGRGLSLLREALTHEPMSHEVLSDMAALLLSAGELGDAAGYAHRAMQLQPHHGASLYTLGFALAGLGEHRAAHDVLQQLTAGPAHASLMQEAPDLLPLVKTELQRLQVQLQQDAAA